MKQFIKPAAIIVAAMFATFSQPATAASNRPPRHTLPVPAKAAEETPFSIQLNRIDNREVIKVDIDNPGKKNLSITLKTNDGYIIDNFNTGKKLLRMNKDYNFSQADEGSYMLIVTDGKHEIKHNIKLERASVLTANKLTVQ